MDLAYESSRFRSYYGEESSSSRGEHLDPYYRGDSGRGLSSSAATKGSGSSAAYRDGGRTTSTRERDYGATSSSGYDRDFDRSQSKRYSSSKDTRDPYDDYMYTRSSSTSERVNSSTAPPVDEYRTLCLSNLNDRIPDATIKEAITQEFKQFGEFNVKMVHVGNHRFAYVNFRYAEDAREAKRSRTNKLFLFDLVTRIDAVYPKRRDSPEYSESSYSRDMYSKSMSSHARSSSRHDDVDLDNRHREYSRRSYDGKTQSETPKHEHKFPHHLHHIQPEDDDKSTRTLFVGNLDVAITDADLRDVFERYGEVEDIDIKRPAKGQGNAYAFVKFSNLDMAHRAKVDMSGRYIGKLQCKIGYGKVNPTNCVWVGGIGPWISTSGLEAEFDRFGVIHRVVWPEGKNFAYVLYDSRDAAQAACRGMRGFPMGGSERRLRVDFAEPTVIGGSSAPPEQPDQRHASAAEPAIPKHNSVGGSSGWPSAPNKDYYSRGARMERSDRPPSDFRSPEGGAPRDEMYRRREDVDSTNDSSDRWKHPRPRHEAEESGYRSRQPAEFPRGASPSASRDRPDRDGGRGSPTPKRQRCSSSGDQYNSGYYDRQHSTSNGNYNNSSRTEHAQTPLFDTEPLTNVQTVEDMAKNLPVVWSGALVLKTSAFSTRMHLVSGNVHLVDTLMRDQTTTEMPLLKITQRLRMDQSKLDDMGRRVSGSGPQGYSVLLAMPGSETALEDANTKVQHRPLKNLVSYLKQKEAAGVIALPPNSTKEQELGVLHAFPPSNFGQEYLLRKAPKIGAEPSKEDHMVVIVLGGSA